MKRGDVFDEQLFRARIEPDPTNNLHKTSEIMVDKVQSVPRERVGEVFGHITYGQMLKVSRSLVAQFGN